MKNYVYETSCVDCGDRVEALNKMIDEAVGVNYLSILRNCQGLLTWAQGKGYVLNRRQGLTLKDDWHVSFHRSTFDGKPCYYLVWSAIEFIWTKRGEDNGKASTR